MPLEDQYVFTCAAGKREYEDGRKEEVMVFGTVIDDDGKKWAIISSHPIKVPVDEVAIYSREKTNATSEDLCGSK